MKIEKKRRTIVKGNVEMEVGNVIKRGEDFFFFFCFSLLKNDGNLFWVYQNGNFYREKTFHGGKKNQEK